jgi:hypothetical protein
MTMRRNRSNGAAMRQPEFENSMQLSIVPNLPWRNCEKSWMNCKNAGRDFGLEFGRGRTSSYEKSAMRFTPAIEPLISG